MKVLSLFDGISACQQAFKNLGIEFDGINNVYFSSEIDKYAIQVTQKNFPNIIQLGDVKNLSYTNSTLSGTFNAIDCLRVAENIKIDLLCGGSPCQDLSIAKKNRKGLSGERSGLFFEYVRILKEVNPKFFILENVASMSKESKELISKELFNIEPVLINSSLLTAQQRKRLYWVGKLQQDGTYKKVEIEQPQDKRILLKDILESGLAYQEKSHSLTASYNGAVFWNSLEKKQRTMVAEPIRIGHLNKGSQGDRIYSIKGKSVNLSANGGGRGAKTGLYKIDLPDGDYLIRKLTPIECERLQGFKENYTSILSNTQRYKALGNSFTVPVIEHILKKII